MTTIRFTCPTCSTELESQSAGAVQCPSCGQSIELGEPEVAPPPQLPLPPAPAVPKLGVGKEKVDNGLGWWTAVTLIVWLFFLLPGGFLIFPVIFNAFAAVSDGSGNVAGGMGMNILFLIPGAILAIIGSGLARWAKSKRFGFICGGCGNPVARSARLCPVCKSGL